MPQQEDEPPQPNANGHAASETSPLLTKIRSTELVIDGNAPEGPLAAPTNGTFGPNDDGNGDNALERQTSAVDRQKQYEGMPEVKAKLKYIFPAVAIGVFMSAADQTLVVSSKEGIGSELHALNMTSWIATAYFLTLTCVQPLYGKLSDIFGRKSCLLFGYTIFGLGCLGCGLAQNMEQLIAARAFSGIGGGAMTTVLSILLSDVCTLRERGTFQGYINIVWATGASVGAPLGGIAADFIGWRWAFLVQAPLSAVAFLAVFFVLDLPSKENTDWRKNLRRIDFLGALVLIAAVFTYLLALDRGSNVSWNVPIAYVPLAISIPLFVLFVFVETKIAVEPFAPGHIIFNRTTIACYLANFFSLAGWMAVTFYVPLFFQAVDHVTATGAGVRLIPGVIFGVLGSLNAGIYMQKTGHFYWLTVMSYGVSVLALVVIFLFSGIVANSSLAIIIAMAIGGFGNGNGITTTLIGVIANASHEDQAVATACSYLFRSLGSVFGISVSATVANQSLRKSLAVKLPALGLPEEEALNIADKVRQSLRYLKELDPKIRGVVEYCFARSTNAAFGLQIALIAGAAISAWFIREKKLSK